MTDNQNNKGVDPHLACRGPRLQKHFVLSRLPMPDSLAGFTFVHQSGVYRILKAYDLIASTSFIVMTASDEFSHPAARVNEL